MSKRLFIIAALALLCLSCSEMQGPVETVVLPETLTIKGLGCEFGADGRLMYKAGPGRWTVYAEFTTGQGPLVRLMDQDSNVVYRGKSPKSGIYRLEYDYNRATRASWVSIDKVSLMLAEGADATQAPTLMKYLGDGTWSSDTIKVSKPYLRFRYELETNKPDELCCWCAGWDNNGTAPEALTADYLKPRELGEGERDHRYIAEGRACWMLPESAVPSLDTLLVSFNDGPSQQVTVMPAKGHKGPAAVFIGDSITWQWTRDGVGHPTYFSDRGWVNAGISGNTTAQMLDRFRAEVIAADPVCVVIEGGTNDIANSPNSAILGRLQTMAELALASGIKVVMGAVPPCNNFPKNPGFRPEDRIIELNDMIRAYALSMGFPYADYYAVLVDDAKGLKAEYQKDEIHPNAAGYTAMEGVIQPIINELLSF